MKRSRIIAFMAAVILLVTVFFSYEYIIQNAHHNCSGEECTVCMELAMAAQTISHLKVIPVLSFSMTVLCVFTLVYTGITQTLSIPKTLITLKVELLD